MFSLIKLLSLSHLWWYTLIILAFRRWRQGDYEFKASLNYTVTSSCLKKEERSIFLSSSTTVFMCSPLSFNLKQHLYFNTTLDSQRCHKDSIQHPQQWASSITNVSDSGCIIFIHFIMYHVLTEVNSLFKCP